jgi:hypothetical protein
MSTTLALFAVILRVLETPRQKPLFRSVLPLQGGNKRAQTHICSGLMLRFWYFGLILDYIFDPEYGLLRPMLK